MVLSDGNVPQPDWRWAGFTDDPDANLGVLREMVELMPGDSVIVKATGSSGSRGHTKGTKADFQDNAFAATALLRASTHSHGSSYLVEELLTGVELSVETLWLDGEMIPLNAVERPFSDDPEFSVELGHLNPWLGDESAYRAVWDVAERAGRAVGLDNTKGGHIFKVDMIVTDAWPKVLELTVRLSGGFDSQKTTPAAHGANYTKGALLLALRRDWEALPYFAKRWHRHAVAWAAFGPAKGGIIREIRGLEAAGRFGEVITMYSPGDVLPPLTSCTQRVVFVVVSHSSPTDAKNIARYAAGQIQVVVE
jgi:biotin carboxylase